ARHQPLFQKLFLDLVIQVHEKTKSQSRRKITMPLKTLEYSPIPLNLTHHKWAISGVKLHSRIVFMENGLSSPDQAVLASANEHHWVQLELLLDDNGC